MENVKFIKEISEIVSTARRMILDQRRIIDELLNHSPKFMTGEKVYTVVMTDDGDYRAVGELTIGKSTVSIVDSPGVEGREGFDNYKPQKSREESYMCVETGIESGSVFDVSHLHSSREEAEQAAIAMMESERSTKQ